MAKGSKLSPAEVALILENGADLLKAPLGPTLEDKVKHLLGKVVDDLAERAGE